MRHRVGGRKLGRTTSHRWALFKNMATSLVEKERIETTLHKAKELRSFADKLITLGKKDNLAARRQVFDFLRSRSGVSKVFSELAPRFKDRQGGYTRIIKLGYRLGDSAAMALIEYLPGETLKEAGSGPAKAAKKTQPKAKKEAEPKKAKPAKAAKAVKTTKKKEESKAKKTSKKDD